MEFNKDDFKVLRIPFSEAKEWVLYKHYAHRIPPVSFAFGLYGGGGATSRCLHLWTSGISRLDRGGYGRGIHFQFS